MKVRSLTTRLVAGTILVALLAALAGAATAAFIARGLWQVREQQALRAMAADLERAIGREASEEGWSLERAAPEAIRESVVSGHRVEVWRDGALLAASVPGPTIGPDEAKAAETMGWIVETRPLPDGLRLVVASPREKGREALRILTWSLVLSVPVSLAMAALVGRLVGRRATRPLVDFTNRIARARPFQALEPAGPAESSTTEVQELERSFATLWERLGKAALREREFAANASHELRTPLTRMRLQAERARASAGPAGSSALDDLVAEVDRMVRLADSLLVMSREVTAGIPAAETVNLSDVVAATCRRVFLGTNEPELSAPDEALVRADEALIGIAVENLLDNARKFTPRDGVVRLTVWEAGGRVGLAVTSQGARVAPGDAERLFERFYRAPEGRAARDGHGLGLPLARHIARMHCGDVRFVASPDADARFELDLPAWRGQAPPSEASGELCARENAGGAAADSVPAPRKRSP